MTVRRHLVQYNGYEASTEGDSFILAFYDANEALRYALATQQVRQVPWCTAGCRAE